MEKPSVHAVVARYKEDIGWVKRLPEHFQVFVYNKGPELAADTFEGRHVRVIARENVGRESETYANHLVTQYDACADWTYFLQGNPFEQAPHALEIMAQPSKFPLFNPLCNQFVARDGIPPENILNEYMHRTGKLYRFERMSTYTIIPIMYHDASGCGIFKHVMIMNGIPPGTNLMRYFMARLGLQNWIDHKVEVINLMWGAMFGASRSAILQHPRGIYERLVQESVAHQVNGFLIERSWCLLFDRSMALAYEP